MMADEAEHRLGQSLTESQHRLFGAALHLAERDGEESGPEGHLQHFVVHGSLEEAAGDQVLEEAGK